MTTQIVIAKAPRPGRSKTRLCPPCTPQQASEIAAAALADTLDVARAVATTRRVLCLDGETGSWYEGGFDVIPQRGDGLDERLASAFEDAGAPALVIGMDTPQVTAALLERAVHDLAGADAVLGEAEDGGWWTLGLRAADRRALEGVPMSVPSTGREQLARLRALGLRVRMLPVLRDVDTFADAVAVAAEIPGSRFEAAVRAAEVSWRTTAG